MKTIMPTVLKSQHSNAEEVEQYTDYITMSQQTSHRFDVFIDGEIGPPSQYRSLIYLLFSASASDKIVLFINSQGGYLDTALAIVEGVKHTSAHVTAILIGSCHSAASIIAMYCHECVVLDNAYAMVHTTTFESSGSTGNVHAHVEFTVMKVNGLLEEVYGGFLSKEELDKIKSGAELWFNAKEIRNRMLNRTKFLASKTKQVKSTKQKALK